MATEANRNDGRAIAAGSDRRRAAAAERERARFLSVGPRRSAAERDARAGYDDHKRRKGSKIHLAVDTLGHLLALQVTPANEQDRAQVADLTAAVQEATGAVPAEPAGANGIDLAVVRQPWAKRGFLMLPRRSVMERSFAWASRFRRLAQDDEQLPETVAGLHFVAFSRLMVRQLVRAIA